MMDYVFGVLWTNTLRSFSCEAESAARTCKVAKMVCKVRKKRASELYICVLRVVAT